MESIYNYNLIEESSSHCYLPELLEPDSYMQNQQSMNDDRNINVLSDQLSKLTNAGSTTMIDIIVKASSKRRKSKNRGKFNRGITKSSKSKRISSYRKNICGYITKKVLRQFICGTYKKKIEELCEDYHANYIASINFYQARIQGVTGPSHIPALFASENIDELPVIRVFVKFFKWFLNQRYIRHLALEGKMDMKSIYIEYKNKEMIPLIAQIQHKLVQQMQSQSTFSMCLQFNQQN